MWQLFGIEAKRTVKGNSFPTFFCEAALGTMISQRKYHVSVVIGKTAWAEILHALPQLHTPSAMPYHNIGMRILFLIAKALFVLAVPVLLLTATMRVAVSTPALYRYSFNNWDASAYTGISDEDLDRVASSLTHYFNSAQEYWDVTVVQSGQEKTLLSTSEQQHFKDIKGLVRFDYTALICSLAYILLFVAGALVLARRRHASLPKQSAAATPNAWLAEGWREVAEVLKWGAILAVVLLLLLLGAGLLTGFDNLFIRFHELFFTNHLWIAQPDDVMAYLFPEGFFMTAGLLITGAILVEAAILGGIGWKFSKGRKENQPAS